MASSPRVQKLAYSLTIHSGIGRLHASNEIMQGSIVVYQSRDLQVYHGLTSTRQRHARPRRGRKVIALSDLAVLGYALALLSHSC